MGNAPHVCLADALKRKREPRCLQGKAGHSPGARPAERDRAPGGAVDRVHEAAGKRRRRAGTASAHSAAAPARTRTPVARLMMRMGVTLLIGEALDVPCAVCATRAHHRTSLVVTVRCQARGFAASCGQDGRRRRTLGRVDASRDQWRAAVEESRRRARRAAEMTARVREYAARAAERLRAVQERRERWWRAGWGQNSPSKVSLDPGSERRSPEREFLAQRNSEPPQDGDRRDGARDLIHERILRTSNGNERVGGGRVGASGGVPVRVRQTPSTSRPPPDPVVAGIDGFRPQGTWPGSSRHDGTPPGSDGGVHFCKVVGGRRRTAGPRTPGPAAGRHSPARSIPRALAPGVARGWSGRTACPRACHRRHGR